MTVADGHGHLGGEVVDLLTQMVAYQTESRSSNLDLIDYVMARATDVGAAAKVVEGAPGRANLFLRFGPEASGGLLVSGHTDVVPAGEGWSSAPYLLTSDGTRLRGRGTADMKGFISCALAVSMNQDTSKWSAPLYFGLSYDEEIGCAGVPSLLEELSADPAVDPEIVVVGEPTMLSLCTSHTGKVAYSVRTSCQPGHSSLAPTRTNALGEIVSIAAVIAQINGASRTQGVSTNVGTMSGGVAVNVLAPRAELTFECRHLASTNPDDVLAPLWSQIEQSEATLRQIGGTVDLKLDGGYPALHVDEHHPAVTQLADIIGQRPAGHLDFGCEAGLYHQSLGVASVVFGPGDIGDAHRPDEFVEREQLDGACRSLLAMTDAYCGRSHDRAAKGSATNDLDRP